MNYDNETGTKPGARPHHEGGAGDVASPTPRGGDVTGAPIHRGRPDDLGNYCTCHEGNPWTGECLVHARALCPFGEPLHCDKDGCPACIWLDADWGAGQCRNARAAAEHAVACDEAAAWYRKHAAFDLALLHWLWHEAWVEVVAREENRTFHIVPAHNDDTAYFGEDIPF